MDIILKPTTAEEYTRMTTTLVKTRSGAVFRIRAMGANSMVYLLRAIPEDGISDDGMNNFLKDNFELLSTKVIAPCIVEPKVPSDEISFVDLMDIFTELMELSGMGNEGVSDRDSFREEPDRPTS